MSAGGQTSATALAKRSYDKKRRETLPWRNWYKKKAWSVLRLATFTRDNFTCRMCGRLEHNTSLLVADHVVPHKGNEQLFWDDANLQTLCKSCHDGAKQSQERVGYSKQVGVDGWPLDEKHPVNY